MTRVRDMCFLLCFFVRSFVAGPPNPDPLPNGEREPAGSRNLTSTISTHKRIVLIARNSAVNGLRLPRLRRLDRTARLLPGAEAALDMGDGFEPHALRRLRGQRRAQAAGAEEQEALVLRKDRLVIGAVGIDPE